MHEGNTSKPGQGKPPMALANKIEIDDEPMDICNYHRPLLNNLTTGVVMLDETLRLRYLNMAAEALLDVSSRKAADRFLGDLLIDNAEDLGEIRTALANNSSFTKRKAELNLIHGKTMQVDYTVTPFEDNGQRLGILELHSLEHAHRLSKDELFSSAHSTTRELVRGLAHEIKNPLGGIRGAAQLLAQELDTTDLTDYTNIIIEEADRLRNLVDRLSGNRTPPDMTLVNVHEVLERVRSLVLAEHTHSGVNLVRDFDPSIPGIMGDMEQLIQATLNILRNAMQALAGAESPVSRPTITLRTRVKRNVTIGANFHRMAVVVQICDNGPGIPDNMKETIFYPMISGRADGTGLGLSITHAIINQHNGYIECDSKPGATCFSIYMPLADVDE